MMHCFITLKSLDMFTDLRLRRLLHYHNQVAQRVQNCDVIITAQPHARRETFFELFFVKLCGNSFISAAMHNYA